MVEGERAPRPEGLVFTVKPEVYPRDRERDFDRDLDMPLSTTSRAPRSSAASSGSRPARGIIHSEEQLDARLGRSAAPKLPERDGRGS